MRNLGIDVRAKSTVWCLVDEHGEVLREGEVTTTAAALTTLVREVGSDAQVLAGQEVGTHASLVHAALTVPACRVLLRLPNR